MAKPTEDCVRIALAGGSLDLSNGSKPTDDLVQIALACRQGGGTLTVQGTKPIDDLIQIVKAAPGQVIVRWKE